MYTFIFLPETHGKKLSEITEYFANSGAIYLLSKKKSSKPKKQNKIPSRAPKDIVKNNKQNDRLINNEA